MRKKKILDDALHMDGRGPVRLVEETDVARGRLVDQTLIHHAIVQRLEHLRDAIDERAVGRIMVVNVHEDIADAPTVVGHHARRRSKYPCNDQHCGYATPHALIKPVMRQSE